MQVSILKDSADLVDSTNRNNNCVLSVVEREQIRNFFSGLGTNVFVSSSLANLYEKVLTNKNKWRLIYTGIPVLLHDKGSAKARSKPRVTLCLAERVSGFGMWLDIIDNLSEYRVAGDAFHTMCLSSDHRQVIGFSFDSSTAACELWNHIEVLTSDPENIALKVPSARKKKRREKMNSFALPEKSQISLPCQFHHVRFVPK